MPNEKVQNKYTLTAGTTIDDMTQSIIESIQDVKGLKITDINLENLEMAPAYRYIICQGKSTTQVSSIADNVQETMRNTYHLKPYSIDGYRNSQWIVMDYGSIMVHIFLPEMRELYNLEELWSDAEIKEIADLD